MNLVPSMDSRERLGGQHAGSLHERLLASGTHLALCVVIAAVVLAIVFLGWYPSPLDRICEVGEVLLLLLAVDVVLGPVLTLVVFDRRKKSVKYDLACIGVLQLSALTYGLFAVEGGRPHFLVFVKDRFEVVSRVDLQAADRQAATGNSFAKAHWLKPVIVAAEMPATRTQKEALLFESVMGGRDIQHYPKQYRDYSSQSEVAAARSAPLDVLRQLNPGAEKALDATIKRSGISEAEIGFLPIKGRKGDATMLVHRSSGRILGIVDFVPWR